MKSIPMLYTLATLIAFTAAAGSIPAKEVQEDQILYGVAESFENPAEADYFAIVKATPEYAQIKHDKIEPGTARYFILMSEAGDRAIRVISEAAEDNGYDLVAQKDYLNSLSKPIQAANITQEILKLMAEES